MLDDGAWLRHAAHANAMAARLAAALADVPGARFLAPVQANGVFVDLPLAVVEGLRARGWRFYTFVGATGCRFMCAWDTPVASIDRFAADARELAARGPPDHRRPRWPLKPGVTVASLDAISAGRLPGLLGFRVLAIEEGRLEAELPIRPELARAERLPARRDGDRPGRHRVRLRLPLAPAAGARAASRRSSSRATSSAPRATA